MSRQTRELVAMAVLAAAIAVVATWPIAARFGSAGRVDSGDGRFSVWNVAWVAHTLTTNPREIWNANIFFPNRGALAYSEANLVAGAIAIPVWVETHNPYAAMNSVILSAFVLAALAMFALVRHLTGSWPGATVAAVLYAFSPFAFSQIPEVQLLMTFGPPMALLTFHRFVEAPSVRRAVVLGASLALAGLACGYYGIFAGLAVGLGTVWMGVWSGRWRDPRFWGLAVLAAAVAAILVAPFFAPYLAIRHAGFERTLEDARLFRAGWRSYLASPLLAHQWLLRLLPSWRAVLFPGFLTIALSVVAIVRACRKQETVFPVKRHVLGFYLVLAVLAFWASFGPDAGLYTLLYRVLPLMSFLRAPSRLGLLVTLALVVAGGMGLASLERTSTGWRRRVFLLLVICYAVGRSTVGGLDLVQAPRVSKAYQRLSQLPRGAVVEFPYFVGPVDRHRQTEYMLMSTVHWQPLINGYSDYFPDDAWDAMTSLSTFPSPESLRALEARQARYLVIHWGLYEPETQREIRRTVNGLGFLMKIVEEPDTSLYQVLVRPDAPPRPTTKMASDSAPRGGTF